MVYSRLDPIIRTAGFCLVGALMPAQAVGAEPGWVPVVVKTGKTEKQQSNPVVPRLPQARRATSKDAGPAAKGVVSGAPSIAPASRPPAPTARPEISAPSSVGAIPVTRMLSEKDSARLKVAKTGEVARGSESAAAATLPNSDLAHRYCVNVETPAEDARIAWLKAKLAEKEKEIGKRIAALKAKTAEYKEWLKRRDEFSRKATETLVQIYAQMEPDAAALQLAAMREETAAAILVKLDPQASGAILTEMQPNKGARLTGTIAGAARVHKKKRAAAPAPAKPAGDVAKQANRGGRRQ
jgi:flagellar motility protein MotE (MotC chaperone)